MERLDNPAGRLHAALTAFDAVASDSVSVESAWAKVLDAEGDDLWPAIGEVAVLLPKIEQTLIASDNADQVSSFRHWQAAWARPIFAPDRPFNNGSHSLVDPGSLHALSSISSLLSRTASEGVVPDEAQRDSLRVTLTEAIDDVLADDSLHVDLKQLLLRRLHEMVWALDHVRVVGPDGVQAAAERLAVNIARIDQSQQQHAAVGRVLEVAGMVWSAFHALPAVRNSLEAGKALLKMITS